MPKAQGSGFGPLWRNWVESKTLPLSENMQIKEDLP